MKKIAAWECGTCTKVLKTNSGMGKHEKICFKNPATKSCITCSGLDTVLAINGVELTSKEKLIIDYKVDGTYTIDFNTDPEGDSFEFGVLNKEYEYLNDAEPVTYCSIKKIILPKLRTQCDSYNENKPF